MDDDGDAHLRRMSRDQVLRRLDAMVARDRITEEEAARVRSATDSGNFDAALQEIRVRHARERVAAAVAAGRLTQAEGDAVLARLAQGEDPHVVTRILRGDRS